MKKLKVMTIVGTRPEIIKLSRVMVELDRHVEHVLVHTGQNYDYELNKIFFEDLGLRVPDHVLEVAGKTAAETIGNVVTKTDEIFEKIKPDAVLLYGDTNSCLAVISAKRRKIPIFHMEAGNRSFDQRVPEELNRKIVDHLSDINMPLTDHAREYLLREGLKPETVIKTGSCMKEVIAHYRPKVDASDALKRLGLKSREYFVVSAHREENVDDPAKLKELIRSLGELASTTKKECIFSVHPRTQKRIEDAGVATGALAGKVRFLKPMNLSDYLKLQIEAFCVLSDSGTIAEESSLLGFPAVTMRDAHERPEGMDEGTVIMCPIGSGRLAESVKMVTSQVYEQKVRMKVVEDYNADLVSVKVARIILSYVDYVNRTVWSKAPTLPA